MARTWSSFTDHYRGYPAVLARLAALKVADCKLRLERAWRLKAPKTLVKAWGGGSAPSAQRVAGSPRERR